MALELKNPWRAQSPSQTVGGIYVHIPFCRKKCPYCHFAVSSYQEKSVASYIKTLKKEWEERKNLFETISSIYFGGGTPSIISESSFEEIFRIFPECLSEITLEANPENVTLEKMRFYRDLGINRISIGVQSLSDKRLEAIGREHSAKAAINAVETTVKAGFKNITIDLMYDLPNQSIDEWKETVLEATKLEITHISLYNLVFEPGALYYKNRHAIKQLMPSDNDSTSMLTFAINAFEDAGFNRYEISAFSKEGYQAVHNTSYWNGAPFIGVGPSAFSYHDRKRFRNSSYIGKWQAEIAAGREPIDFEEELTYPNDVHELLTIQLRLLKGVDLSEFALPQETVMKIDQLVDAGYLKKSHNRVALTTRGTLFYDTVASELI